MRNKLTQNNNNYKYKTNANQKYLHSFKNKKFQTEYIEGKQFFNV